MNAMRPEPLVEVDNLVVSFARDDDIMRAVNGVSFTVMPGEVLCLIGESGSGKSVTMRALMGLLPRRTAAVTGRIRVGTHEILALDERRLAALRGALMAMIFQEPMTALDPVYTIGHQIAETVRRHARATRQAAMARALELLQLVKVPSPERRLKAYPHELSGGMRQRAMIAIALACQPALLLADEPTTALDATVQVQVLILLRKLQQEFGMGLIFVTHDLGVAAQIADRVAVMYAGRIVEEGSARDVLLNPRHPYTMGMLASTLNGRVRGSDIEVIPGSPPDTRALPPGCSFAPRCRFGAPSCRETLPASLEIGAAHRVACLRLSEVSSSTTLAVS
ncbi:MAG TPA: ABC transporter ATP-binding protein [Stellaceae bacterium]|jgi:peptide/nickel transport system ATP-binding protein|nr:ABC transporter ATP-binding protein [Stellaceae bacterium]